MKRPEKSSKSSSAAEIIGGHDDLLTEILLLLPANSLLRFKSVSKHWNSLISSNDFSRRHLLHHRRPETQHSFILGAEGRSQFFMFHPATKKLARFSFPRAFPFVDEHVKILDSSHGLLLLECAYRQKGGYRFYYVFNPVTQRFREIHGGNGSVAMTFSFNPSKSIYYDVIGRWRDHSLVYRSDYSEWSESYPPDFLVPPAKFGKKSRHIVKSNERLHCINLCLNQNKPRFYISEMINYKWSKSRKIDWYQLKELLNEQRKSTRGQAELLGMMREERVEDSVFMVHVPGQIIMSRLRDEVCEVAVDYRDDYFYQEGQLQFKFKNAHAFLGSFADV